MCRWLLHFKKVFFQRHEEGQVAPVWIYRHVSGCNDIVVYCCRWKIRQNVRGNDLKRSLIKHLTGVIVRQISSAGHANHNDCMVRNTSQQLILFQRGNAWILLKLNLVPFDKYKYMADGVTCRKVWMTYYQYHLFRLSAFYSKAVTMVLILGAWIPGFLLVLPFCRFLRWDRFGRGQVICTRLVSLPFDLQLRPNQWKTEKYN